MYFWAGGKHVWPLAKHYNIVIHCAYLLVYDNVKMIGPKSRSVDRISIHCTTIYVRTQERKKNLSITVYYRKSDSYKTIIDGPTENVMVFTARREYRKGGFFLLYLYTFAFTYILIICRDWLVSILSFWYTRVVI